MAAETLLMPQRTYTAHIGLCMSEEGYISRPEARGAPSTKSQLSPNQLVKMPHGMDIALDECATLLAARPWPGRLVPPRRAPSTVCVVDLLEDSKIVLEWAYDIPDGGGPTGTVDFAVAEVKVEESVFRELMQRVQAYLSTS